MLKMEYDSEEALLLNNKIFEAIYYGACVESMELSRLHGPYDTFQGSPASQGILQFDMWNVKPVNHEWEQLK
jgi:ribonucleotide reductase alpha subunit